jgi:hypothetical protein
MDQTNWLTLIGNLGFPIIVSWYLLTRVAESNPYKARREVSDSWTPPF